MADYKQKEGSYSQARIIRLANCGESVRAVCKPSSELRARLLLFMSRTPKIRHLESIAGLMIGTGEG